MSIKVLGISTSPRVNGNSDLLLKKALAGAESAQAQVEYLNLSDYKIAPCTECDRCLETGNCSIEDDYQIILTKILDADRLIFATPVFFMTVCAQAKALIDRCQCLWVCKYILKKPIAITSKHNRRAMAIAVGGSRSREMFESIRQTMKYYLDALEMHYAANLFVSHVDEPGKIQQYSSALEQAHRLGRELITSTEHTSKEPVDIELTF